MDYEVLFQLFLSLILGGIIGIDRELKRKPGGLRTHILICMGATFIMIISKKATLGSGDPSRIAAQVISGIGFIGGGVIMRYGFNIKGITTAATIWVVTAIGLGIGISLYWEAIYLAFISMFVLFFINKLEHKFFGGGNYKFLVVDLKDIEIDNEEIKKILERFKLKSKTIDIEKMITKNKTRFKFLINIPRDMDLELVIKELTKLKRIQKISVEE